MRIDRPSSETQSLVGFRQKFGYTGSYVFIHASGLRHSFTGGALFTRSSPGQKNYSYAVS